MIQPIITQSDFLEKEEKRKTKVINQMVEQKERYSDDYVWKCQLRLELMTKSERLIYAINTKPTFEKTHKVTSIQGLTTNLHTVDDQGFEGQIIENKDGLKWFCRWILDDLNIAEVWSK